MWGETEDGPDWWDAAPYAALLDADRSLFAWEWLRRDPGYRAAAEAALAAGTRPGQAAPGAERFGLLAFEPPGLTVPHARPLWRAEVHPFVLAVDAGGTAAAPADKFDVDRMHHLAQVISGNSAEHLLLSDGLRPIRLDGPPGTFSAGPVCLRYSIEGVLIAEAPVLTLRRFLALCRTGHFSRSLHPSEARARRWILMLRAFDALSRGADLREIASQLLNSEAGEPRWRSRCPSLRSQAQRLVRAARRMASGRHVELLR